MASAGAALVAYADEVRPIQAQLVGLRSSASEFVTSVQGADDWQFDGGKVAEHNGLLSGVSSAVAAWMEAQRRCANAIAVLDGGVQYVADNGDGTVRPDEYGYPAEVLGAAAASEQGVPWGRPVERDRPWYEDAVHAVGSAGKGLVVDGLWGGAKSLSAFVNPWSDDFGASWAGMAKFGLIVTSPELLVVNHSVSLPGVGKGELERTLVDARKGIVAWDTWKTDPARAFGATLGNVITAVVGIKGAGAGLKAASALKDVAAARLASITLPKLADIRIAVSAQLAKIPKIDIRQFTPAFAGAGGSPEPFKFDLVHPSADTGRMHNQAPVAAPGAGSRVPVQVPPQFQGLKQRLLSSGRSGRWTRELHRPAPDTVYVVDGKHIYVTDGQGRVTHVQSSLQDTPKAAADLKRNGYQQKVAGRQSRLKFDEGGHLIAASLGGPGEGINLVAMAKDLTPQGAATGTLWRQNGATR